jgi:hypothetical protein
MLLRRGRGAIGEEGRRAVFRLLVLGQDMGMTVAESRQMCCDRFSITEEEVRQIEREGVKDTWPPLCGPQ